MELSGKDTVSSNLEVICNMYSVILLTIPILTFVLYTVSTSNLDNDEMELSGKDTVSSKSDTLSSSPPIGELLACKEW